MSPLNDVFSVCVQEKVEITKEQQALVKVVVEAYNRHQIPQDVAKKLVNHPQHHSAPGHVLSATSGNQESTFAAGTYT